MYSYIQWPITSAKLDANGINEKFFIMLPLEKLILEKAIILQQSQNFWVIFTL